jgi:hypothetical protein
LTFIFQNGSILLAVVFTTCGSVGIGRRARLRIL